ncbi:MAG: DNA translocase FtsK [bacterium]|nr:DNA translocase FtsK [bacterium]
MPTAASPARKAFPRLGISPKKGNEILGFLLAAFVVLLAGSLFSYHPLDPSLLHQLGAGSDRTHNFVGPFGAQLAALFFSLLGLSSLLVPVLLGIAAWRRLSGREISRVKGRGIGIAAVLVSLPALLQLTIGEVLWRGELLHSGGAVGVILSDVLATRLNPGGAFVVLLALLLAGVSLAVRSTLGELLSTWRSQGASLWERLRVAWARRRKRRQERAGGRPLIIRRPPPAAGARRRQPAPPEAAATPRSETAVPRSETAAPRSETTAPRSETATPPSAEPAVAAPAEENKPDAPLRVTSKKGNGQFAVRRVRGSGASEGAAPRRGAAARQEKLGSLAEELPLSELPPIDLLQTDSERSSHDEAELVRRGEVISRSSGEFGVEGTVVGISPGPVITVYEFQPAPGVKVSRIVSLQDDLALALKAESVRIDRIPGRSTLGIEVPNDSRSVIHLGNLLADDRFERAPSVLTMALGADIHGRPYYADLAKMPHLLVAGATGSGKSVGLQSMITSILYKATREQVQFIFIDPKRIELGVYADIPHLKAEVVVEPKKAANALRWAVAEMERRYRLLAEVHVRSIAYYNRAIRDPGERARLALKEGDGEFRAEDLKPLPYYVIIIDELADLMMVASSDVEASIARLTQMARAVGIHLIVATQRPSVDVLTGTIKANFPCRLSYATASRHDSRTILDQVGAEKLLGRGDALVMPPGSSRILRMHGAYITEQETAGLIRWLKRHGKPELDPEVVKAAENESEAAGGAGNVDDDLFDEAARLVVTERKASASYLQRRLRIGFSRAARLIDMLEADGLLGPSEGSKSREVLVPPDYFDEIDRAQSEP